jgi:hypothetical protein
MNQTANLMQREETNREPGMQKNLLCGDPLGRFLFQETGYQLFGLKERKKK